MTAPPENFRIAASYPVRPAWYAYGIGEDGHLFRRPLPPSVRGGILFLSEKNPPRREVPLAREILSECLRHAFDGVAAVFSGKPDPARSAFLAELAPLLHRNSRRLFVAPADARLLPTACVSVNTAISGGTLSALLSDACHTFGARRIALDVERVRMDFPLPSPSGEGKALDASQLASLHAQFHPTVFYSRDLCAKYFTYLDGNTGHFVLFDDAETISQKLRLAERSHIPCAFLLASEVDDLLPAIHFFPKAEKSALCP